MKFSSFLALIFVGLSTQVHANTLDKEDVNWRKIQSKPFTLRCAAYYPDQKIVGSRTWEFYLKNYAENGRMVQRVILARHSVMDKAISDPIDKEREYYTDLSESNHSSLNEFSRGFKLSRVYEGKDFTGYEALYLTFDIFNRSMILNSFEVINGKIKRNDPLYFPNCM
ncbi:hypothetical protein [Vibrio cholerae]|uniref:hypothetical protein n=1 Tax=Vibrio cholerae TaxID=666 RepID=UPI0030808C88